MSDHKIIDVFMDKVKNIDKMTTSDIVTMLYKIDAIRQSLRSQLSVVETLTNQTQSTIAKRVHIPNNNQDVIYQYLIDGITFEGCEYQFVDKVTPRCFPCIRYMNKKCSCPRWHIQQVRHLPKDTLTYAIRNHDIERIKFIVAILIRFCQQVPSLETRF